LYSEAINFSLKDTEINPIEYINKRAENYEKLNRLREMDQVLAAISYQLKISQNYSQKKNDIFILLEKIIEKYSEDTSLKKDALFTIKLCRAVSLILLQKEDYKGLKEFTEKAYKDALKQKIFNRTNHDSKLQMLTFLVNALFKLKDYKNSLIYADILKKAMLEYDKLHYQKYEFFYNNTLVINYSVIDIDKAIDILKKMQESIDKKHMVFYDVFTYINLSLCYYKKNKYDDAIKQIIKVKTFDVYKNADEHLRLKIDIAEQIIRFEMTDYEIIDYRIQQIKREFKKLLTSQEALRENEMLKLLLLMSKTPDFAINKKLLKIAKETIAIETEIEEFIDYNEWILKKFKNLSA
jgi:tetratricopeptide (TPR) repeat protein